MDSGIFKETPFEYLRPFFIVVFSLIIIYVLFVIIFMCFKTIKFYNLPNKILVRSKSKKYSPKFYTHFFFLKAKIKKFIIKFNYKFINFYNNLKQFVLKFHLKHSKKLVNILKKYTYIFLTKIKKAFLMKKNKNSWQINEKFRYVKIYYRKSNNLIKKWFE